MQSNPRLSLTVLLRCAVPALLASTVCLADVVHLRDGGRVEGVITEQSERSVTVDLGFGTTTVERSDIDRIERSGADGERGLKEQRGGDSFDQSRLVPPRLSQLAESLSVVSQARSRAYSWNRRTERLEDDRRRMEARLDTLRTQYLEANSGLKAASPNGNVRYYNSLVADVNRIRADLDITRHEIDSVQKELDTGDPAVSRYAELLSSFESYDRSRRKRLGRLSTEEKDFLAQVDERLKDFRRDFNSTTVEKPERIGKHIVVSAEVNRRTRGKFILDTGASVVCMSKAFADRLGVELENVEPVEVTLADGKAGKAKPLVLGSVTVQGATVEDVGGVVLDNPPAPGVDGLLGMSFLGKFFINIDVQTNTLELRRFTVR